MSYVNGDYADTHYAYGFWVMGM